MISLEALRHHPFREIARETHLYSSSHQWNLDRWGFASTALLATVGLLAAGSLIAIDALPKKVLPGQLQSTIPANADADYDLLPKLLPPTLINDRPGFLLAHPIVSIK